MRDSWAPRMIDTSWQGRQKRDEKLCVPPVDVRGTHRFRFFERCVSFLTSKKCELIKI